jgi:hypothetical protein
MHPNSAPAGLPYELAQVTQLELASQDPGSPIYSTADSAAVQQLGIQLKVTTRALLRILSRRAGIVENYRPVTCDAYCGSLSEDLKQ